MHRAGFRMTKRVRAGPTDVILIADDDPAVLRLLRIVATRAGFAVDTATNGADAWEKVRTKQYLIAVVDLMMPGKSGYNLLELLRSMERRPAVIVVSAMDDKHLGRLDLQIAHAVIRKPFDVESVAAMLREVAQTLKTADGNVVERPAQNA